LNSEEINLSAKFIRYGGCRDNHLLAAKSVTPPSNG